MAGPSHSWWFTTSRGAVGAVDAIEYPVKPLANVRRFASAPRLPFTTALVVVTNITVVRVISRETSRTPSTDTPFHPFAVPLSGFVAEQAADGCHLRARYGAIGKAPLFTSARCLRATGPTGLSSRRSERASTAVRPCCGLRRHRRE